jgi:hypothetical protein
MGAVVILSPSVTTNYTVTGTGANNCINTDTISIIVNPALTASFILRKDTLQIGKWDAYPNYSATINAARWYWGDGTSTIGLYPSHIYAVAGNYMICVTAYSSCGDSISTCQNDTISRLASNSILSNAVYINVINNTTTGIKQVINNTQVTIYPNPSSGIFAIQTIEYNNTNIEVYNLMGQKVFTDKLQYNTTQINLSSLVNGMYQVRLIQNNTAVYQAKISKVD